MTRFQNEKFKQAATVTPEGLVIQSKSETYFDNIIVDIKLLGSISSANNSNRKTEIKRHIDLGARGNEYYFRLF